MANFTIHKYIELTDHVGCTEFQTHQMSKDIASLGTSEELDGDIVWHLDADAGYIVKIDDFRIPDATAQIADQYTHVYTNQGGNTGIPHPILGIVFSQAGDTRIIITIYLHPFTSAAPIFSITGNTFEMPDTWVSAAVVIDGCAMLGDVSEHLELINRDEENIDATVVISSDLERVLIQENRGDGIIEILGVVPSDKINEELLTYTLTPKQGKRFMYPPHFSISRANHYTKSSILKDDLGNIISTTISVYKKA